VRQTSELQHELIVVLKKGGFHLRKWSSNHPSLLEGIILEDIETRLPISKDS
jgi:hypothetical protein